ncbi:DUF4097 domain-containing protein [Methanoculleus sp. Wushi-C6]|uniref:DUF4097 domain-containing protein n=1 Tax=Methanoculleus caldifontis TaxID=2651577 RepID=A0ABU3WZK5_9EURY|nr:DUF4097 family beta strand repeat-containing protein [Methanoculleus sp. Wushi-C6]MDV2481224.1 DUF4097 domain-containing protein [Methanoculleus sp. Wushi-C6]
MQKTGYAALALLVLAAALSSGCTGVPGLEATEEFNRTVAVEPGSGITVINHNGGVNVDVREGEAVSIRAVKRSAYGESELDKVRIEVTEGDPLRVETVRTGLNPQVSVEYTISLPPTVVLRQVESSNGPITLSGVRVNETDLLTSNGPVLVDGAPGGDLAAVSSNGRIEVRGAEGYVAATTSNAPITVERSGGVTSLETSNGRISAEIPALRGDVDIRTSNGAVALRLAEDLDARLVAVTSNGRIAADNLSLRLDESSGTRLVGTLGSGGPTIAVTTSNGGIDLSAL